MFRPVALAGLGLLLVGAFGGALISGLLVGNRQPTPSSTATIAVDNRPLPGNGQGDAVSVAQQLNPAVGTIIASAGRQTGLGSGFVISNSGGLSYLLTNNHVVGTGGSFHVVMPDGKTYTATVVGTDSFDDLAVVSVPDGHLPVAVFGSSSNLKVGQRVVAIGSPLGNQGSVTSGVVSALHRTIQAGSGLASQETLQDVLQTDTPINAGNSGGPLADTAGRVVGVNVAVAGQASSIGFSIPSDIAQVISQQLIAHRTVQHPFIGISYVDPIDAVEAGQPFDGPGVKVITVQSGSPAGQAGVAVGDIILSVDGTALDNGQTLGGVIQKHHPGDKIGLKIKRGSQTVDVTVTLSERPASGA